MDGFSTARSPYQGRRFGTQDSAQKRYLFECFKLGLTYDHQPSFAFLLTALMDCAPRPRGHPCLPSWTTRCPSWPARTVRTSSSLTRTGRPARSRWTTRGTPSPGTPAAARASTAPASSPCIPPAACATTWAAAMSHSATLSRLLWPRDPRCAVPMTCSAAAGVPSTGWTSTARSPTREALQISRP